MKTLAFLVAATACSSGSAPAPTPTKTPPATSATAAPTPPDEAGAGARAAKFKSDALGVEKRYRIYLPADYDTSTKRYPVFYYLHGLGGNEDNWVEGGELDKAAATLALEAIVVMPDGDDAFYINGIAPIDYDKCMADGVGQLFMPGHEAKHTTCVKKRDYDTYITKDLIAHVDATYRTIATREGRAIAGLSMGGFGALQLSMRHPDLYSAAASHSGLVSLLYGGPIPYDKAKITELDDLKTWGGPFVEIRKWMFLLLGDDKAHWREVDPVNLVKNLKPGTLALYIDCGTEDDFLFHNQAAQIHDLLLDRKIEHEYFLGPGHHTFAFWRDRIDDSLAFLRDHTAKAK